MIKSLEFTLQQRKELPLNSIKDNNHDAFNKF